MEMMAVSAWLLALVVVAVYRRLGALRRDCALTAGAIRSDIAALHSAHEYARVEHLRVLSDVEAASAVASNEVRMAASTVRAVIDSLAAQTRGGDRGVS